MDEQESLNRTKWEYKYHVVFIPKCRRKILYQELRRYLGEVFRRLAEQKESQIEEGHLRPDHVHMMISIPPKYAVSQVIGYVKGKSAIHLARVYGERRRQPSGPRSKSWLRNVVTSQPIGANSWSSPPVRGWRPRTLSPCYSRPRQAREQAPDPDAPPSTSRSSHRK